MFVTQHHDEVRVEVFHRILHAPQGGGVGDVPGLAETISGGTRESEQLTMIA
jgi:hypothetical protein